jgi:hypothetical protein
MAITYSLHHHLAKRRRPIRPRAARNVMRRRAPL